MRRKPIRRTRRIHRGGVSENIVKASGFLTEMTEPSNNVILSSVLSIGISNKRFRELEPLLEALITNTAINPLTLKKKDIRDIGLLLDYLVMNYDVIKNWYDIIINRYISNTEGMNWTTYKESYFVKDAGQSLIRSRYYEFLQLLSKDMMIKIVKNGAVDLLEDCKNANKSMDLILLCVYANKIDVLEWMLANGLKWNDLTCMNVGHAAMLSRSTEMKEYIVSKGCAFPPLYNMTDLYINSNFNLDLIKWYNKHFRHYAKHDKEGYEYTLYSDIMIEADVPVETYRWVMQHFGMDEEASLDSLLYALYNAKVDIADVQMEYLLKEMDRHDIMQQVGLIMSLSQENAENAENAENVEETSELSEEEKSKVIKWLIENGYPYEKLDIVKKYIY